MRELMSWDPHMEMREACVSGRCLVQSGGITRLVGVLDINIFNSPRGRFGAKSSYNQGMLDQTGL